MTVFGIIFIFMAGAYIGFSLGIWIGILRPWWVLTEDGMKKTERYYQAYKNMPKK